MTPAALEKAAMALPAATLSIPWGDDRGAGRVRPAPYMARGLVV